MAAFFGRYVCARSVLAPDGRSAGVAASQQRLASLALMPTLREPMHAP